MRVAVPHSLGKDEARSRLKARAHEVSDFIPGGMAQVAIDWPAEDRMAMHVAAMGQSIDGTVEVEDNAVVFTVNLPAMLSFVEPMIERAIADKGRKLLT